MAGTIADKLNGISDAKAAIAAAIAAKGGTVPAKFADYGTAIATIPPYPDPALPVKFIDYDGTLLHSYSLADAAALASLPPAPTHSGLTFQDWNYTLSEMKDQASVMGSCIAGANYITSDGKTRVYIKITDANHKNFSIRVSTSASASGNVIDWGDGSTTALTQAATPPIVDHVYNPSQYPAEFCVTIGDGIRAPIFIKDMCPDMFSKECVVNIRLGCIQSFQSSEYKGPLDYLVNLESISIPNNVYNNRQRDFMCTCTNALKGVVFPRNVSAYNITSAYSLEAISWPINVTGISCSGVNAECLSIPKNAVYFDGIRGLRRIKSLVFPSSAAPRDTAGATFAGCTELESVSFVGDMTGKSYGVKLFQDCALRSIVFPSYLSWAYCAGCRNLKYAELGANTTIVATDAFKECYSLSEVKMPYVTSIGNNAFNSCSLLSNVSTPSTLASIGASVFSGCLNLRKAVLDGSYSSVGNYLFQNCSKLVDVTLASSLTTMGNYAFSGCSALASVVLPSSVTNMGTYTFQNCTSLTSVTLPSSLTSIGNYAFYGCSAIPRINVPSTVTSVGSYAFRGCSSCTVYDFSNHASVPTLANTNAFTSTSGSKKIVVPDSLYDTWIAASNWNSSTNSIKASIIKKTDFDNL